MMGHLIDGEQYVSVVEAARRIGVCKDTIRRWIRLERLRARKIGFQHFVPERMSRIS